MNTTVTRYLQTKKARREAPGSDPSSSSSAPEPTPRLVLPAPPTFLHLPDYRWLSRVLYSQLLALHDDDVAAHSPSPLPLLLPEVMDVVVEYVWEPLVTHSLDSGTYHLRRRGQPVPSYTREHCSGRVHVDTTERNDWSDDLRMRILHGWRIRSVRYWHGMYANGLQVTYASSAGGGGGETMEMEGLHGSHHQPVEAEFVLEEGERIRQVRVEYDVWYHRVFLDTSKGRTCVIGTGEPEHMRRTPLPQRALLPEVEGENYEVLAFMLGVGGHIHNLGCYYQRVW